MIADSLEKIREKHLSATIPEILNFETTPAGRCRTLLYVGAKPGRIQMVRLFLENGFRVDVLEAWSPNAAALEKWNSENPTFGLIWKGNIRTTSALADLPKYDVTMFWHGPEHVTREDLPFVLKNLEGLATRAVILGCPWGRYSQDAIGGNPFERHVSSLYEEDFSAFGYRTSTIGTKDKKGSHLLAWKEIR
jgi:hypothetical protein